MSSPTMSTNPDAMSVQEMEAFLSIPRLAKLSTLHPDGSPHLTPLWFEYRDGFFLTTVEASTVKRWNIERDPRVAICIEDSSPPYRAVIAQGVARLSVEGEKEVLLGQAIRYLGQAEGAKMFESVKDGEGRLVTITPDKIITFDRRKRNRKLWGSADPAESES